MTNLSAKLQALYKKREIIELVKRLPHVRKEEDPFVKALCDSLLLEMGTHVNSPPITLGADPEFILCKKGKQDEVVLFSSEYANNYFGLSAAELGADYGLLEMRPAPQQKPKELVEELDKLHKLFSESYADLDIMRSEALEYNHRRARVLEELNAEKIISYGMGRGKDISVWSSNTDIITGVETGQKLSAYDEPIFSQYNPDIFTAGGHIHIGGSFVMMLSLEQIKGLVRRFEDVVTPLCRSVETPAAELRRTVYGNKGEFCLKSYGIEWRAPANSIFWPENRKTLHKILKKIKKIVLSYMFTFLKK